MLFNFLFELQHRYASQILPQVELRQPAQHNPSSHRKEGARTFRIKVAARRQVVRDTADGTYPRVSSNSQDVSWTQKCCQGQSKWYPKDTQTLITWARCSELNGNVESGTQRVVVSSVAAAALGLVPAPLRSLASSLHLPQAQKLSPQRRRCSLYILCNTKRRGRLTCRESSQTLCSGVACKRKNDGGLVHRDSVHGGYGRSRGR